MTHKHGEWSADHYGYRLPPEIHEGNPSRFTPESDAGNAGEATVVTDGGAVVDAGGPGRPPTVPELDQDATVVFDPAFDSPQKGSVRRKSRGGTPPGGYYSLEVLVDGREIWDLEANYDPREGWTPLTAFKRVYTGDHPTRAEKGVVQALEHVDLGVEPEQLTPGQTVRDWAGNRYRIVVAPIEREYDDNALAYNLDSPSNVCERLSTLAVRPASVDGDPGGDAADD